MYCANKTPTCVESGTFGRLGIIPIQFDLRHNTSPDLTDAGETLDTPARSFEFRNICGNVRAWVFLSNVSLAVNAANLNAFDLGSLAIRVPASSCLLVMPLQCRTSPHQKIPVEPGLALT